MTENLDKTNTADRLKAMEQVFAAVKMELKRREQEREKRLTYYNQIGNRLIGKTTIEFCPLGTDFDGITPIGTIEKIGDEYRIKIIPQLPPNREASVLIHECVHGILRGDAKPATEQEKEEHKAKCQFILSKQAQDLCPGLDLRAAYLTDYEQDEEKINRLGERFFEICFPGERYEP